MNETFSSGGFILNNLDDNVWIVASAWPTINSVPHLGTILHLLSADVISRYLRLVGERVISVSGSDAHGTPVLLSAEDNNQSPNDYAHDVHKKILQYLDEWNIHLDNYTITTTKFHKLFVQNFYTRLKEQQSIFSKETEQYYCQTCQLFLPDRFIEGTCPKCYENNARGDQCSNPSCNIILTPEQLVQPYCKKCKSNPIKKHTSHYYLDLEKLEPKIKHFINSNVNFTPLVVNESLKFFNEGLQSRAITRDLSWGINASFLFKGQEKVFYVWAEDVLGYLSASAEYLEKTKTSDNWKSIWSSKNTKTVYCLGLDNIFFHAVWLPGLLLAYNDNLRLPAYLSTTQFIQFDGQAFSKSKNIGLWIDEAIEVAPADFWRFYLIYYRPEKRSHNFDWKSFVNLINNEVFANVINLIYREASLIWKYNEGYITSPISIVQESSNEFLVLVDEIIRDIITEIYSIQIKNALQKTVYFAKTINTFLSQQEPWKKIDRENTIEDITVGYISALLVITFLEPVIPTISYQLKELLYPNDITIDLSNFDFIKWTKNFVINYQLPQLHKILEPVRLENLIRKYEFLKTK